MTAFSNEYIVGRAVAIAAQVHQTQLDKGDEPYIFHCLEVAKRAGERYDKMDGLAADPEIREQVIAVGVLHDVLEDFDGSPLEKLHLSSKIYEEFPPAVYTAVDHLTKYKGEQYDTYIERVAQHWLSRLVKLCDLSHNLEAWRIPSGDITDRDFRRWAKYHRAFVRLMRED